MKLREIVQASSRLSSTRSRLEKMALLGEVLSRAPVDEVPLVVSCLSGRLPRGRLGIGYATLQEMRRIEGAREPSLELPDLDAIFRELEDVSGAGSGAARLDILRGLYRRATKEEQDFLTRLLLEDLRQGSLEGVMLEAIARGAEAPPEAVRREFMLSGDLGLVAGTALSDGASGLERFQLELFRPIQPMLAQTAESVASALETLGTAAFETKLDGARIQVHRAGDEVRIFTRNLNDVTDRLPGIVELVRSLPAAALVLDGEAMGVDEDELPRVFQDTMSAFGRSREGPDGFAGAALQSRFFDLLHLDGDDLIDRPLTERLAALERVAGRWRVPGVVTTDPAAAQRVLDESLATGHEGVMVKDATSTYDAGRRGGAWRKVKPVHTLDLVVLAVEWGSGRRRGWLSNLHLGARDPASGDLVMVGKTFKGLTDELLAWQTERFLALETSRDDWVVQVRPEQVVEVALDGVQQSTRYPGGVALRFARVRRYRADKTAAEADTIDAVRSLLPGG